MAQTLLLSDERMVRHDPGAGHPERPARLSSLLGALRERAVPGTAWASPQPAPREAVERVHARAYVGIVDELRGQAVRLDPDTALSEDSVDAAFLAAGAAMGAVDHALGDAGPAFALVRPPGHHAESSRAMGFCVFNNVAVAAEHALAAHGLERVLVIDWDVHHGNGTQHHFEGRRDVLFASSHRYPFYPGTGAAQEVGRGAGEGYTVNVPLPGGCDDGDLATLFRDVLLPIADDYAPQLVLVSAGFDAHRLDPLGGLRASDEGFAYACATALEIADQHAEGRIALLLEGGYDLHALEESVRACLEILGGATPPERRAPSTRGGHAIKAAAEVHRQYWKHIQ